MEVAPDTLEHARPTGADADPRRAAARVLLAGIMFGTAGSARALAVPAASTVAVGALRVIVGGLALLIAMPRLGGSRRRTIRLWRRPLVLVMSLAAALYQVCFFAAVANAGIALGTLVAVGSAPILAGLLGWVALRHRPSLGWVAATGLAFGGLAVLSADALSGTGDGFGLLLALGAGLCIAAWNVAAKPLLDAGAEAVELAAASFALGGLMSVPGLLAQPLDWLAAGPGIVLAIYLGVVTAGLANTWLAQGVHRLGPAPASTLMLADPVTATILGVVVLHEPFGPSSAIGIALVLVGLALQASSARRTDLARS